MQKQMTKAEKLRRKAIIFCKSQAVDGYAEVWKFQDKLQFSRALKSLVWAVRVTTCYIIKSFVISNFPHTKSLTYSTLSAIINT
jgi:predicted amidophosphoribosyltransferase